MLPRRYRCVVISANSSRRSRVSCSRINRDLRVTIAATRLRGSHGVSFSHRPSWSTPRSRGAMVCNCIALHRGCGPRAEVEDMPCACGKGHLLHGLMVPIFRGFQQRATIGRPAFRQSAPSTAHNTESLPEHRADGKHTDDETAVCVHICSSPTMWRWTIARV